MSIPTTVPALDKNQEMPEPKGHVIGFVDTQSECDAIVRDLKSTGLAESSILLLSGADGEPLLQRMMSGSLWGETAEDLLAQGVIELSHGHIILVIESPDREHALTVANKSMLHGGRGFRFFGGLTDERLTR